MVDDLHKDDSQDLEKKHGSQDLWEKHGSQKVEEEKPGWRRPVGARN